MNRFAKAAALAALAAAGAATAAEAQYFPQPGYGPPPGYYGQPRRPPPQDYYGQPRRPPPGYYGGDGYNQSYRRPVQYGQVCLTSRGSCYVGRPLPFQTGCGCNVPGFGYKRGAIGG